MKSILTIVTPATSQDLTLLANVKAEFGITDSSQDANLQTWITQASAAVSDYCNRRFASEEDLETIRNRIRLGFGYGLYGGFGEYSGGNFRLGREVDYVILKRNPVTAFASVVEDTITLVEGTDFECDYESGIMTRLNSNGDERRWRFQNLLVQYTAGYQLLGTLPIAIERATITLIKWFRFAATRDPYLLSEVIPGVRTAQYAVGKYAGTSTGLDGWPPQDVVNLIAPYRQIDV